MAIFYEEGKGEFQKKKIKFRCYSGLHVRAVSVLEKKSDAVFGFQSGVFLLCGFAVFGPPSLTPPSRINPLADFLLLNKIRNTEDKVTKSVIKKAPIPSAKYWRKRKSLFKRATKVGGRICFCVQINKNIVFTRHRGSVHNKPETFVNGF